MFIFLDTETHSKETPILIQLAYIRTRPDGVQDETFDMIFGTDGVPIEFGAMAIHHITEQMIAGEKMFSESEEKNILQEYLNEGYTLIAHNAAFDVGVLKNSGVDTPAMICTLKLARHIYPDFEAHNLQYLRYRLGLEFNQVITPHDALSDVRVLEKLFYHFWDKIGEGLEQKTGKPSHKEQITEEMIQISIRPSLLHRCIFGKYKDTLWSMVPRDYLEWIVFKSGFTDEDVLYTARHYLSNNSQLPL